MQDRIFYALCLGFVLGVLLRSFVFVNFYFTVFLGVLGVILFLFFLLISKFKWGIVVGLFILAFSLGVLRFHISENLENHAYEGMSEVVIEGEIVDDPDIRENNQKLTVLENLSDIETKFLVTTNFGQDFKYGDKVRIEGKVKKPENFITDQGKEFDYINYLRKDGIFYLINYPDIEILSRGEGNKAKSALFFVKNNFLEKLNMAVSPPESLLMGGLILGEKSAFSQDLRQSFVNTGTIHIVALSGYNITIVAEWFIKLFSFLPQALGISMGILAIFLFVLMTGAGSTALRAGIMATLALVARATGRDYDVARALLLAGVIMIFFNPLILVHDVSFQLSFIATVAVIFFSPKIEKYFLWVTKSFGLRDIVSVTTAAYIFVLPFILYKMGNLSLVALPANILVLPFIPLTMLSGFLTSFFGVILPILSLPFGFVSYLLLHYELTIIEFFAKIPFASFAIPNFPLWFTLLIYAWFLHLLFGRIIKQFFTKEVV